MKVGIPTEQFAGEHRVAATPGTVKRLRKLGFDVIVEAGAGAGASLPDADFAAAGATILASGEQIWASADVIAKVRPPCPLEGGRHEAQLLRKGQVFISLLWPAQNEGLIQMMAASGCTAIALDQIPRITRAQKMDVLSSMANIAGYRAVIEAAHRYGGFFGGQITAAGKTRPAQVLVIGAGVAGLAAIAAARGLGGEVRAFDVRPAVKEQVESLGARFLELVFKEEGGETAGGYAKTMSPAFIAAEMALFAAQAREVDIIITTALIPGRPAPRLITEEMVQAMRPGSVVVDLAAEQGGNCACTSPNEVVVRHGVHIIGYTDLTSRLPTHASQFFGTNVSHLLDDLGGGEGFGIDLEDEVVRRSLVIHDGEVVWPPPKAAPPPKPAPVAPAAPAVVVAPASAPRNWAPIIALASSVALLLIGLFAPPDFVQHFTVFILACFVGWQVIWNVTPALHTPLMSVTNAISGIIVVGGLLQAAAVGSVVGAGAIIGAVAVLVATINIAGGFLVTRRMLAMFRKEG